MNYKWVIASVLIPVIAIIAGLTNQEIRCFFRLNSDTVCQSSSSFSNVDLIVQNEKLQSLQNVEVRFIFKGQPEVRRTDSNGFVTIKIPKREDVEVTLSKERFKTQRIIINLENDPDRTRTYYLKEGNGVNPPPPNPIQPEPPPVSSITVEDFVFDIKSCIRNADDIIVCNLLITNKIEDRTLSLNTGKTSRIIALGDQYFAKKIDFGGFSNRNSVQNNLVKGIGIKASIYFYKVPTEVTQIELLEFYPSPFLELPFKVQFFKIPISKT